MPTAHRRKTVRVGNGHPVFTVEKVPFEPQSRGPQLCTSPSHNPHLTSVHRSLFPVWHCRCSQLMHPQWQPGASRPALLPSGSWYSVSSLLFPASLLLGIQSHPKAMTSLWPGTTITLAKHPLLWPCLYHSRQRGRDPQLPFLSHLPPCPPSHQPECRWQQ